MDRAFMRERLWRTRPRVHCLTNPVAMADTANLMLAAGGSAIMAQDPAEAEEITAVCHATLLNTGVPDQEKFRACALAGKRANALGHPVVLDPVGVGASDFRKREIGRLLEQVHMTVIRCNQEEACALLHMEHGSTGGVESDVVLEEDRLTELAKKLARVYDCTVLISGGEDAVSDGEKTELLTGGDPRIARITGSGCMLSALCALFCGAGFPAFDAAVLAGSLWKESSRAAGIRADRNGSGIGSFHTYLFDALDQLCHEKEEEQT